MSLKSRPKSLFGAVSLALLACGSLLYAATAGLPFTEDFQNDALKDEPVVAPFRTTANWTNGAGAVYLNDGGTAVAISTTLTNSGDADGVALGDVDNDGDLDIVVANNGAENLLYRNDGAGGFNVTWIADNSEVDNTTSVALGDIDGDGFLDIVVGNEGQENKRYINDGSGDFPLIGTAIGNQTDATRDIALADVNGDGDLDVVAGNNGALNLFYLNDGSGNFLSFAQIGPEMDSTQDVALVDVNNDLFPDLVVANGPGNPNRVYLNNGSNGFAAASNIGIETDDTRSVAVGDLDNDGHIDVVFGIASASVSNKLYLNNGAGGFPTTGTNIGLENENTRSINLVDHNGDSFLDVIAGNGGVENRRYINNGDGSFPDSGVQFGTTSVTSDLVAGDLDGDGDHEVIEGNASSSANTIYLNSNGGSFSPAAREIGGETDDTRGVFLVDVDIGNGNGLDLVVANSGATNKVYINDGTGAFSATGTDIGSETDQSHAVVAADVDNDGDNDLIVANNQPSGNQTNKVYLNTDGFGDFSGAPYDMGGALDASYVVAVGLLNGDVYPDVVIGNYAQENRVYLNAGVSGTWGGFPSSVNAGSDTDNTRDVILVDVDNDTELDLVVANENETNKFYINDGSGGFPVAAIIGSETERSLSVTAGDIDGDGDIDLVFGSASTNEPNRYYLNALISPPAGGCDTGPPVNCFNTPGVAIGVDSDVTMRVELVDVDIDGSLDYLVAINYQQPNKRYVIEDDVISSIGVPISVDTVSAPTDVVLGDVDNDGDQDMITGSYGQTNKLYRNVSYRTNANRVVSKQVNPVSETGIESARLTAAATINSDTSRNTSVDYYLSNNGGDDGGQWHQVRSGFPFIFPNGAGDDLRWKAELNSRSPILTPVLSEIQIEGNRPPDLGDPTLSITMGQSQPAVTTVNASDPDNNTISYSIVGGVDAALFLIDAGSGALSFVGTPDFEAPTDSNRDNVYHVNVQATDNGPANLTDTQQISVTITSVDDSTPVAGGGGGGGGGSALSHWLVGLLISMLLWRGRSIIVPVMKGRALYH